MEDIGNFRRLGVRWEVDAETYWASHHGVEPFEERMIRSAHDSQFIENEYPRLFHLFETDRERERFFMYYYNWAIIGMNNERMEEDRDFLV